VGDAVEVGPDPLFSVVATRFRGSETKSVVAGLFVGINWLVAIVEVLGSFLVVEGGLGDNTMLPGWGSEEDEALLLGVS
jgi:hypothetical protein